MNRGVNDTVCVHATCRLKPMLITGTPISDTPYTSSSPGMVRCDSCHCSSPWEGKCVLDRSIAAPSALLSRPSAQPLLPSGGWRASHHRSTGGAGIWAVLGGAAVPTASTNTSPLPLRARAR